MIFVHTRFPLHKSTNDDGAALPQTEKVITSTFRHKEIPYLQWSYCLRLKSPLQEFKGLSIDALLDI